MSERRVYWRWYRLSERWWFFHLGWHLTATRRYDGRDRFLWVAIGPLDVRVHVYPIVCRRCGVRTLPGVAAALCPGCQAVRVTRER